MVRLRRNRLLKKIASDGGVEDAQFGKALRVQLRGFRSCGEGRADTGLVLWTHLSGTALLSQLNSGTAD